MSDVVFSWSCAYIITHIAYCKIFSQTLDIDFQFPKMYNQIETSREGGGGAPFFQKKEREPDTDFSFFKPIENSKKRKGTPKYLFFYIFSKFITRTVKILKIINC